MFYEDLNEFDQELVGTEFDSEIEKAASEKVAAIQEVYAYGCEQAEKIASEIDEMYEEMSKVAEEEEDDEDEEDEDEEKSAAMEVFEKEAQELGSFIERGLHDHLVKLGSERHGDPLYYYLPYIEEKIAAKGAMKALAKFRKSLGKQVGKAGKQVGKMYKKTKKTVSEGAAKAKKKVGKFYSPTMSELRTGVTGKKQGLFGKKKVSKKEQAKSLARGLGRAATVAAPAAGAGYLGYKASK